jgi:hypothetical protein
MAGGPLPTAHAQITGPDGDHLGIGAQLPD